VKRKEPKKPFAPTEKGRVPNPVAVRTYVKKGKRIKAYKRHKAGDGTNDEVRGA
jgi:hypothetical protein